MRPDEGDAQRRIRGIEKPGKRCDNLVAQKIAHHRSNRRITGGRPHDTDHALVYRRLRHDAGQ